MAASDFYIVLVEDQVVQVTSYIVRANDEEQARQLVASGVYAFESDTETVDTINSEIKNVEKIA